VLSKELFQSLYAEIGNGYIHVHHLNMMSEQISEYELNPLRDMRPVRPNCHFMLHKTSSI
jgi:5-methylcytosine-specific restriction protein A